LGLGAVIEGSQGSREAHITRKGVNILLIEVRLSGFPAKTAQNRLLLRVIPHPVRTPGHAASGFALGIGIGQDRLVGDGFEQPQANHRRRDAG